MKIANDDEADTTMHLVIDDPHDQIYVTYQGLTLSISLGASNPQKVFTPRPVELNVMPDDDLELTPPTRICREGVLYPGPGDGLRIALDGKTVSRYDRTYRKDG